jgi:flagellar motor switch protein FliM
VSTKKTSLTAEELSALRAVTRTEESSEPPEVRAARVKVLNYNFRQPGQLSVTQLRALKVVHEYFSKRLTETRPGGLAGEISLNLLSVDTVSYTHFIGSVKNPCFLAQLASRFDQPVLLDLELSLAHLLAIRLLGDDGEVEVNNGMLTAIEQALSSSWLRQTLPLLSEAWALSTPIDFTLKGIETDPRFVQVMPDDDPVVVLAFNLQIGSAQGRFTVCYPLEPLQQLLEGMSRRMVGADETPEDAAGNSGRLLASFKRVPFEMRAELGTSSVLTGQLARLKVGDVLCLERKVYEPLDLYLGTRRVFNARLGRKGDRLAVQLSGRCAEND